MEQADKSRVTEVD